MNVRQLVQTLVFGLAMFASGAAFATAGFGGPGWMQWIEFLVALACAFWLSVFSERWVARGRPQPDLGATNYYFPPTVEFKNDEGDADPPGWHPV